MQCFSYLCAIMDIKALSCKVTKWIARILLSIVGLLLLLIVAIYLPPVQQWLKNWATDYLSEETGMKVEIERVKLSFPLDLVVENMSAVDGRDTVAAARELLLDIKVLPLFKGQIDLNRFELREARINTKDFISDTHVEGRFRLLAIDKPTVCDLSAKHIDVNRVRIKEADVRLVLSDTAAVDTTPSEPVEWKIALGELKVDDTKFYLQMPGDSMRVNGNIQTMSLARADINLKDDAYKAGELQLEAKDINYDIPYEKNTTGLDANHLKIPQLSLHAQDISYVGSSLDIKLRQLALKEQSGLEVSNLSGELHYDSTLVSLNNGHLQTPYSDLGADISINPDGRMAVKVNGDIGKKDIALLAGDALGKQLPDKPLSLNLRAEGTMERMDIDYCHLTLPGSMEVRLSGSINQLNSDLRRNGKLHYTVALNDASFLRNIMPKDLQKQLRIPNGTRIGGDIDFRGNSFNLSRNTIYCGKGSLSFTGNFSAANMSYNGRLVARQFPVQLFLPGMGLSPLTGSFDIKGKGTDFLSPGTTLVTNARIDAFTYAGFSLNNIDLQAEINGTGANGHFKAANNWLNAALNFNAQQQNGRLSGTLDGNISRLSLKALGASENDMSLMADVHVSGFYESATKKMAVGGNISNLNAVDSRLGYPGGNIRFGLGTSPDSTHIYLNSGDLTLRARSDDPFDRLLDGLTNFGTQFADSLSAAHLNHNYIRTLLPEMKLHLQAGNANPLHQFMSMQGYTFDSLYAHITTNKISGINGDISIANLKTGDILLENSRLNLRQDSDALHLNALIENTHKRNPNRFSASINGSLFCDGFRLLTHFKDEKGNDGLKIGTQAQFDGKGGISFTLIPEVSTIAYRQFKVNNDNFLRIDPAGLITANIDLLADDNTNLKLFSIMPEDADSLAAQSQDITLSIANLNLYDLSRVVPFLPSLGGWLDGDVHIIKTPQNFTAVGQLETRKLVYEGLPIGNLGTELFYMPEDNGHYVVAQILSSDKEVAVLDGHYYDRHGGTLDATLSLNHFPTPLLNTFLSDDGTMALRGWLDGDISVSGPTSNLTFNGQLKSDSVHVYSELYGFDLTMEDRSINIDNGKIVLDNMKFYGRERQAKDSNLATSSPLFIDGTVDFGNLDNIIFDLAIRAKDFHLISADRTKNAIVYGDVFVNMDLALRGKEGFMMLRGDLDVLGKTDFTYIMRDSPLQVDDQFSGLVEFIDFSDDSPVEETVTQTGGLFMAINLNIDKASHLHCELSEDGKSYLDCNGGGDLQLKMFPSGDMSLDGRFNIMKGEMKYTLPFIPLKTFTFAEGNYLLFNGDIDNPLLHITATERNKAAVTDDSGKSRMVLFNVGVRLSRTLSNMGIEFIIDAPEDSEVQNELASMSTENKNKVAITMLATGLYMSSNNKTGFKANNALNAFLESEIKNIAGNALKTVDISLGVEGNTTIDGETQTDYTFQFSKKFWNDRVNFIVGGKVSTGASDNTSSSQSFIDNISLEYRLDRFGTRYIQIFYDNDTHDPFEGSYSSAGAGYIWRRKTNDLGELIIFRKKKNILNEK